MTEHSVNQTEISVRDPYKGVDSFNITRFNTDYVASYNLIDAIGAPQTVVGLSMGRVVSVELELGLPACARVDVKDNKCV